MHQREFPLPDVTDPSYFVQNALVDNGDKVHGAFFVRVTSELILVLDENLPRVTRAKYFKEAARFIKYNLVANGIKSTHIFVTPETDRHHAEVLKKHFGFVETTGIPLYWEIE